MHHGQRAMAESSLLPILRAYLGVLMQGYERGDSELRWSHAGLTQGHAETCKILLLQEFTERPQRQSHL